MAASDDFCLLSPIIVQERAEGREEGREEARIELLMELVEEHIITSDQMFFKLTQSDADKKVIEKII